MEALGRHLAEVTQRNLEATERLATALDDSADLQTEAEDTDATLSAFQNEAVSRTAKMSRLKASCGVILPGEQRTKNTRFIINHHFVRKSPSHARHASLLFFI